ncbi:MAG: branched-chain amino acid ABC transporter permease [Rhodobacteraceae bacterium]|nr:branched-chain amino acid ABC transporter permease [Paracoccaceae bacterium]
MSRGAKAVLLHAALLAGLLALNWVLPDYHRGNLARVMVLAVYAMGYNLLFGYTGLLSLGHALFFAAGMYGLALPMHHLGLGLVPAFGAALLAGAACGLAVGLLALRTTGVAFMIVTLMFAQAGYLAILIAGAWTRGDEGFTIPAAARQVLGLDLTEPGVRYLAAWALFAAVLAILFRLVRHPAGRVLVAIRENEERARLLGYDTHAMKLLATVLSATVAAAGGAAHAALFGYAGASFAAVQYSILPLLWVLLGGAGTLVGPFVGTLFMFYLIDWAADVTPAYMLLAGLALILLTLFLPQGIMGLVRGRLRWLP